MNNVWKNIEKEYIRVNASTMKDEEMVPKLEQLTGRSISLQALRKQKRKLGIIKKRGRGHCEVVVNPINAGKRGI